MTPQWTQDVLMLAWACQEGNPASLELLDALIEMGVDVDKSGDASGTAREHLIEKHVGQYARSLDTCFAIKTILNIPIAGTWTWVMQ